MSLNTDSPDAKKPCKGILKSSSSFDKRDTPASVAASASHRKSAKFDELNVLQTYHPPDKDYGHMKVDEPKTPYNYVEEADVDQLDAELLAEKLRVAANSRSDSVSEEEEPSSEEEEENLTEDQKKKKGEFERRRKAHYNEFEAVKLARKLIEEEDEDDDDGGAAEDKAEQSSKSDEQPQKMEVEDHDEVDRKNGQGSSQQQPAAVSPPGETRTFDECSDRVEIVFVDNASHRSSIHEETRSIRVTRKSVFIYIGITFIILTLLFTFLVVFLFQF